MIAILVLIAYLLGSIPTSVWIGKMFYNIDVREFGSGNAGATNTFRVLGKKAGVPVLILDILKGTAAVALSYSSGFETHSSSFLNLQLGLGLAALIGHIFPVFAGFRGGKGVATIVGIVMCILPLPCAMSLGVFLLILLTVRMVSVASMTAGLSFPFFLNIVMGNTNQILSIFSVVIAVLLIITHRKNIRRILKKEESKVKLFSQKTEQ